LLHEANDASGVNAGFFGLLLALVARPVGTDLMEMPMSAAEPGTGQEAPLREGPETPGGVIVSGISAGTDLMGPLMTDTVTGDRAPMPDGCPCPSARAVDEAPVTHVPGAGEASADVSVMTGGDAEGLEGLLAQAGGRLMGSIGDPVKWFAGLGPAGESNGGGAPVWPARILTGTGGQAMETPPGRDEIAVIPLPSSGTGPAVDRDLADPFRAFFTNEIIKAGDNSEESVQSQALGAFARMAESSNALRQPALRNDVDHTAIMVPAQGANAEDEADCTSPGSARAESILNSIAKTATVRRIEPIIAREDVEDAFVFDSPQGAEAASGKSAPAEDPWARSVVMRIHEETVDARAAGKTSARFEITTENGELIRVRIAMSSNTVSARIGVMDAETREILTLHIPELNQRLEMENLVPERFEVYVMHGDERDGQRGQQRKSGWSRDRAEEPEEEDSFMYVSSDPITFEKWA
jgi:hypothetical protein